MLDFLDSLGHPHSLTVRMPVFLSRSRPEKRSLPRKIRLPPCSCGGILNGETNHRNDRHHKTEGGSPCVHPDDLSEIPLFLRESCPPSSAPDAAHPRRTRERPGICARSRSGRTRNTSAIPSASASREPPGRSPPATGSWRRWKTRASPLTRRTPPCGGSPLRA